MKNKFNRRKQLYPFLSFITIDADTFCNIIGTDDPDYLKWLNLLITPGSLLGGARPKASVLDKQNNLWIAKFPNKNDEKDVAAWKW